MNKLAKTALSVTAFAAAAAGACVGAMAPRRDLPGWESFAGRRFAHRGLHDLAEGRPENSLSAFRAAAERGFGAELDVHLMRDGSLAVVHDSRLARVTGRDAVVEELTAEDLAEYPLLGSGETISLLEDVLAVFAGGAPLIVELKTRGGNHEALVEAVMGRLKSHRGPWCLESFDPQALICLKKKYPEVIRGQLSENFLRSAPENLTKVQRTVMTDLLTTPLTRPDFIAYNHLDRDFFVLRAMRRLYGVHEVSWTVRDRERMAELEADGCVVIFEGFLPN